MSKEGIIRMLGFWGNRQKNAESHAYLICGKLQALYWAMDSSPAMNRSRCFLEPMQETPLRSRWESLWEFGVSETLINDRLSVFRYVGRKLSSTDSLLQG